MKIASFLAVAPAVLGGAIPEAGSSIKSRDLPSTGGQQFIPTTAKADGTFAKANVPVLVGEPPDTRDQPPDVYGPRDIDLPFGRLFHGHMNFLPFTTDGMTRWGSSFDSANQSACGIPYNAFFISTVAIHPYFLKYAGLDRYCMQDVCISFWKEDGSSDMMLKVTDICTPDSADGVPCTDPMDIKIDRTKAKIMEGLSDLPQGNQYPEKIWWFFTKCWDDGLPQPAYQDNGNWFTDPPLPNNLNWSQTAQEQQWKNNQVSYPAKGWETYPNGAYDPNRVAPPINDWDPNNVPAWAPIAGGKSSSGNPPAGGSSPPSPPSPPPPPSNPTPAGPSSPQQTHWGQCGGQNWNGPTSCADGTTCQVQNPYYSQCL